jgi:hypothetical protein
MDLYYRLVALTKGGGEPKREQSGKTDKPTSR